MMFDPIYGVVLDVILKIGSLLSYFIIALRYFTKRPRFNISDLHMILDGYEISVDFKIWNGKTRFKRFRTSDALNVSANIIPITSEGEALSHSASNEPAGAIPVGRFHPSFHLLKSPKKIKTIYVRVKCSEAELTKNFKVKNYVTVRN